MSRGTNSPCDGSTTGPAALTSLRVAARNLKLLSGLSALLVLAACAPMQSQPPAPVVVPSPPTTGPAAPPAPATPVPVPEVRPPPPRVVSPPVAPDAVSALLQQASSEAQAGHHDAAIALGERAQRLDPRAPEVYLVLGRARLARGQPAEARQLALKGLALSVTGTEVRRELEALLRDTGS